MNLWASPFYVTTSRLALVCWVVIVVVSASAETLDQITPDYSRVAITTHNMSQDNNQQNICGFCHTPVYSKTGEVPMWQSIPLDPFYQDGDQKKLGEYRTAGPASLICLYCHDKKTSYLGTASEVPMMEKPHPVGMPFKGLLSDTDSGDLDFGVAHRGRYGQADVWWVETDASGFQPDDILLFPRQLNDGRTIPFVECASCHDPHSPNPKFLRTSKPGQLCYACHPNI